MSEIMIQSWEPHEQEDVERDKIKPKKTQSESLKRAKAKYYNKKKIGPEFMEQNRYNTKEYYVQIQNVIKRNTKKNI